MLLLRRAGSLTSHKSLHNSLISLQFLSSQPDNGFQITQSLGSDVYQVDVNAKGLGVKVLNHTPATDSREPDAGHHSALYRQLAATFLPAGYPKTVTPGYLKYVGWQTLHHCCSSANGVLASTFMLYAVGLGSGAIPTAGALNWVLKDGLGQLGTLLFGRVIAHNFDVNARLWYLLASVKLDLAIGMEICSFLFPQHFLLLGSVSNALKGLAWMAGGSTRSSFNVTFAKEHNIADITAKATSQTICTSLIGTSAGIALASYIGQSSSLAISSFAVLSAVHLWSGYESARSVPLATLNPSRMWLLIDHFLQNKLPHTAARNQVIDDIEKNSQPRLTMNPQLGAARTPAPERPAALDTVVVVVDDDDAPLASTSPPLPNPSDIALKDPILSRLQGAPIIKVGTSIQKLTQLQGPSLWQLYANQRHILIPERLDQQQRANYTATNNSKGYEVRGLLKTKNSNGSCNVVHLVFHELASSQDCVLAMLHTALFYRSQHTLSQQHITTTSTAKSTGLNIYEDTKIDNDEVTIQRAEAALHSAHLLLPELLQQLKIAGWDAEKTVLEPTKHRAHW